MPNGNGASDTRRDEEEPEQGNGRQSNENGAQGNQSRRHPSQPDFNRPFARSAWGAAPRPDNRRWRFCQIERMPAPPNSQPFHRRNGGRPDPSRPTSAPRNQNRPETNSRPRFQNTSNRHPTNHNGAATGQRARQPGPNSNQARPARGQTSNAPSQNNSQMPRMPRPPNNRFQAPPPINSTTRANSPNNSFHNQVSEVSDAILGTVRHALNCLQSFPGFHPNLRPPSQNGSQQFSAPPPSLPSFNNNVPMMASNIPHSQAIPDLTTAPPPLHDAPNAHGNVPFNNAVPVMASSADSLAQSQVMPNMTTAAPHPQNAYNVQGNVPFNYNGSMIVTNANDLTMGQPAPYMVSTAPHQLQHIPNVSGTFPLPGGNGNVPFSNISMMTTNYDYNSLSLGQVMPYMVPTVPRQPQDLNDTISNVPLPNTNGNIPNQTQENSSLFTISQTTMFPPPDEYATNRSDFSHNSLLPSMQQPPPHFTNPSLSATLPMQNYFVSPFPTVNSIPVTRTSPTSSLTYPYPYTGAGPGMVAANMPQQNSNNVDHFTSLPPNVHGSSTEFPPPYSSNPYPGHDLSQPITVPPQAFLPANPHIDYQNPQAMFPIAHQPDAAAAAQENQFYFPQIPYDQTAQQVSQQAPFLPYYVQPGPPQYSLEYPLGMQTSEAQPILLPDPNVMPYPFQNMPSTAHDINSFSSDTQRLPNPMAIATGNNFIGQTGNNSQTSQLQHYPVHTVDNTDNDPNAMIAGSFRFDEAEAFQHDLSSDDFPRSASATTLTTAASDQNELYSAAWPALPLQSNNTWLAQTSNVNNNAENFASNENHHSSNSRSNTRVSSHFSTDYRDSVDQGDRHSSTSEQNSNTMPELNAAAILELHHMESLRLEFERQELTSRNPLDQGLPGINPMLAPRRIEEDHIAFPSDLENNQMNDPLPSSRQEPAECKPKKDFDPVIRRPSSLSSRNASDSDVPFYREHFCAPEEVPRFGGFWPRQNPNLNDNAGSATQLPTDAGARNLRSFDAETETVSDIFSDLTTENNQNSLIWPRRPSSHENEPMETFARYWEHPSVRHNRVRQWLASEDNSTDPSIQESQSEPNRITRYSDVLKREVNTESNSHDENLHRRLGWADNRPQQRQTNRNGGDYHHGRSSVETNRAGHKRHNRGVVGNDQQQWHNHSRQQPGWNGASATGSRVLSSETRNSIPTDNIPRPGPDLRARAPRNGPSNFPGFADNQPSLGSNDSLSTRPDVSSNCIENGTLLGDSDGFLAPVSNEGRNAGSDALDCSTLKDSSSDECENTSVCDVDGNVDGQVRGACGGGDEAYHKHSQNNNTNTHGRKGKDNRNFNYRKSRDPFRAHGTSSNFRGNTETNRIRSCPVQTDAATCGYNADVDVSDFSIDSGYELSPLAGTSPPRNRTNVRKNRSAPVANAVHLGVRALRGIENVSENANVESFEDASVSSYGHDTGASAQAVDEFESRVPKADAGNQSHPNAESSPVEKENSPSPKKHENGAGRGRGGGNERGRGGGNARGRGGGNARGGNGKKSRRGKRR